MKRCTKIVATIGPASESEENMRALITAGMNVARMNFSHGAHQDHAKRIEKLRSVSIQQNTPVTVLMDLQGPKIRTGKLREKDVELQTGKKLILTTQPIIGDETRVSVDFPDLPKILQPGNRVLLADGNMELLVLSVTQAEIKTEIVLGGTLSAHKGVNLPGVRLDIPGFTNKDQQDLIFGLQNNVDAIAMSFVRTAEDIINLRQKIAQHAPDKINTPLIAKLERPEALDNLHDIVTAADGVMVARGDLGVEMSPEEVPIAQKEIIKCANQHAKLVITATQMLESMIFNPRPTRAEASDVANAIFDGTDAVMLSGETAIGQYPIKAVEMMNSIICQAEKNLPSWGHWLGEAPINAFDDAVYVTRAARELAHDRNVAAVAVFTLTGRTAMLMAKERPGKPILAFTPDHNTYYRLPMFWGVTPYLTPEAETVEQMISHVEATMLSEARITSGQQVIVICGFPVGAHRTANLALLHTIGTHFQGQISSAV